MTEKFLLPRHKQANIPAVPLFFFLFYYLIFFFGVYFLAKVTGV